MKIELPPPIYMHSSILQHARRGVAFARESLRDAQPNPTVPDLDARRQILA